MVHIFKKSLKKSNPAWALLHSGHTLRKLALSVDTCIRHVSAMPREGGKGALEGGDRGRLGPGRGQEQREVPAPCCLW